jgi:hypothetical protein
MELADTLNANSTKHFFSIFLDANTGYAGVLKKQQRRS